jgi:hypothetical protein
VDQTIVLSAGQMDAITAGAVIVGPVPLAVVQGVANATGFYTYTATGADSIVTLSDPFGLPAVFNTYGTFTSGAAIAVGTGGSSSRDTSVSTTNQQPLPNAIGVTIGGTVTGINTQVTYQSTAYYSGAWLNYALGNIPR